MSSITAPHRALFAVVAIASVTACAKPPSETIASADAAVQSAMAAGVEQYAPEALNAVSEAKAALDAELAAQGEKMSLTRSYKQAEELALAFQTAAEQATVAAAAGMEKAKNDATTLVTESRMALEQANALLATAPRGKGSAADLAAMKADLESVAMSLTEAETALAAGMYMEAHTTATAARQIVDRVAGAVSQAQTARR